MRVIDRLSSRDEKVAALAVIAAVCGVLAVLPVPSLLRAVPLLILTLIGPGSAVMCWIDFPPAPTIAAVVGISVASLMGFAGAMLWLRLWYPLQSCLIVALIVAASGLMRLWTLRNSVTVARPSW